jgi:hypothetical protein
VANQDKIAARFCRQVAAWVPDMYCNFYSVKNNKIAKDATATRAKEKEAQIWNIQNFRNFLMHI